MSIVAHGFLILFMPVHSSCMKIMFLLNSSLLSHDRHVVYYVINFPFCAPIVQYLCYIQISINVITFDEQK